MLSRELFAIAQEVIITEEVREPLMNEILYADGLVLMNKSIENLRDKCKEWKEVFESKRLKIT